MTQTEVCKKLNISTSTLIRYRKKLGIFSTTKKNITAEQFEQLKRLQNGNDGNNAKKKKDIKEKLQEEATRFTASGKIVIDPSDSIEVKNLKTDYNNNRKFIEYFQQQIENDIKDGEAPYNYLINAVEKYQKLNIHILTAIEKISGKSDSLEKLINERLLNYE